MASFLLTPSLHDAYFYYKKFDFKTDLDFLNTLNKVKEPTSEAMLAGIQFEQCVQDYCDDAFVGIDPAYDRCVEEVAAVVNGGLWQEKLSKDITLNGQDYLLYGRSDVIKRDWIYDIKFSKSYDIGKYRNKIQHLVYMYLTGIEQFAYLVCDGKDVYREEYFWQPDSEAILMGELRDLVGFIEATPKFRAAFHQHWQTKYPSNKDLPCIDSKGAEAQPGPDSLESSDG